MDDGTLRLPTCGGLNKTEFAEAVRNLTGEFGHVADGKDSAVVVAAACDLIMACLVMSPPDTVTVARGVLFGLAMKDYDKMRAAIEEARAGKAQNAPSTPTPQ